MGGLRRCEVELCQTAVTEDAESRHILADVRHPHATVPAKAAGDIGIDHHTVAGLEVSHALARVYYCSNVLVAEDAVRRGRVTGRDGEDMNVRATDARSINPEQHIIVGRNPRHRSRFDSPFAFAVKNHGLHH